MDRRVTLALAGVAAAMFAFIVLVESGSLTTGEVASRRGHVVERFVRARVSGLVLEREGTRIRLLRHREVDEDLDTFDVGTWTIEEPIASPADPDSVDALLSAVEWLDARRELSGVTAEDRARFGLDAPRATLRITVADEEMTVLVGGDDPRGEGVYLAIDTDPERAYVVGTDFPEALEHDVDHFRRKELFPDFRTRDASTALLTNASGTVELEREGGRWRLRRPVEMYGRASTIEEMLRALTDLRAARFLAETDEALEDAWGLSAPSRELAVTLVAWPAGSTHAGEARPDLRVRVGAACPDHEDEVVVVAGAGPVVCVDADSVTRFDAAPERLREARVVATPDDDVERVEIEVGDARFSVRRDDDGWLLVEEGAGGPVERAADATAVEEWLGALRREELTSLEPATDDAIAARGLTRARATLTLTRTDDGGSEIVRLGGADDAGVWVRRGDEAQLTHYGSAVGELLVPTPVRFRARRLVDRQRDEIDRITVVRGGAEERLEKDGSAWRVVAPFAAGADGATAGDVTDAFGPLEAVRFVAAAPAREHGLEAPRATVRVHYAGGGASDDAGEDDGHGHGGHDDDESDEEGGGRATAARDPLDVALRIGAPAEGGAFAQLEGEQTVFVVGQALVDAVLHPLVSRDVLAVAASDVASVTILHGAARHALVHADAGWTLDGSPAPADATQRLFDRLADLRAIGTTAYGGAIARPVATVEVVRHTADSTMDRLTIGAREGSAADAWHEVRREGLDVGFRVRASVIDAFLAYPSAPAAP